MISEDNVVENFDDGSLDVGGDDDFKVKVPATLGKRDIFAFDFCYIWTSCPTTAYTFKERLSALQCHLYCLLTSRSIERYAARS